MHFLSQTDSPYYCSVSLIVPAKCAHNLESTVEFSYARFTQVQCKDFIFLYSLSLFKPKLCSKKSVITQKYIASL